MRVLVLTNFFASWTGSEIVALEVAEHFGAVTSSFFMSEQLRPALPTWRPVAEIDLRDFDLVWAQHHALPVLLNRLQPGERCPAIVTAHLSPYDVNDPPAASIVNGYADLVLFNSYETLSALSDGITVPTRVFGNAAPRSFYRDTGPNDFRSVLVVSNHCPPELEAAVPLIEAKGVKVRRVGVGGEVKRITPADIHAADAVVSIGKTVSYALAARVPAYVYDRFGGDGWVTAEERDAQERTNFSGRLLRRTLSPEELARDILSPVVPPPPRPSLENLLDWMAANLRPKPFDRSPELATCASLAAAAGAWCLAAKAAEQELALPPDPRLAGEAGSWGWLAMCLGKKIVRTPVDIAGKLRGPGKPP